MLTSRIAGWGASRRLLGVLGLLGVLAVGCGRARYTPADVGTAADAVSMDAPPADAVAADAAPPDAVAIDATVDDDAFVSVDAPELSDAFREDAAIPVDAFTPPDAPAIDASVGEDSGVADASGGPDAFSDPSCVAAFADPAAASDSDLFRCGVTEGSGRCRIAAAFGCGGGCACDYYVTNPGWDCPATCPTDLTRTGCIQYVGGSLAFPPAPFACGAATTVEELGACIMRHELLAGHCAPCGC